MSYYTHTQDPIGCFTEKEVGNYFEYSVNDDPMHFCEDFPHKIWVGDQIGSPYRYGLVKKTVAYICTDEDEFGLPVTEKWYVKNHNQYAL